MVLGVDESQSGTKPEDKEQVKPSSESEGGTPDEASKVSPEETEPLVYTQKQFDSLMHAARSEFGRERSSLEKERDTFKSQLKSKEVEIEDIQVEREAMQKQIDELTSDDPKKFDLIKRERELREEQRNLRAEKTALESDKTAHAERIKLADETMREIEIWDVASEYDAGDPVKLKTICDTFQASSVEQIRNVADTLWQKRTVETKPPIPSAPKAVYSGRTDGGKNTFSRSEIADREFWEKNRDAILQAQAEGRITDN